MRNAVYRGMLVVGAGVAITLACTGPGRVGGSSAPDIVNVVVLSEDGGTGTVTSNPPGMTCTVANAATCSKSFVSNPVTLTATPDPGSAFWYWEVNAPIIGGLRVDPCLGIQGSTSHTVSLTFQDPDQSEETTCLPVFAKPQRFLVVKTGTGTGTVDGTSASPFQGHPQGILIACGPDCDEIFLGDLDVDLTATADPGSTFTGWAGLCSGGNPTLAQADTGGTCEAEFTADPTAILTVDLGGTGTGTVTGPGALSCPKTGPAPATCTVTLQVGTQVTLDFSSTGGSTALGTGGVCTGAAPWSFTLDQDRTCSAQIDPPTLITLTVTTSGTGTGTVTSVPPGAVACPGDCQETKAQGDSITLQANPGAGSSFTGWSGACTGTQNPKKVFFFGSALTCDAQFDLLPPATVTIVVAGQGTVTSVPPQYACDQDNVPSACIADLPPGHTYQLTAAPGSGYALGTWSGTTPGCTGSGQSITITVPAGPSTCTKTFLQTVTLTVSPSGTGAGTIFEPGAPRIDCSHNTPGGGSDCSESAVPPLVITLDFNGPPGTTVTGGGVCTGATFPVDLTLNSSGDCSVTIGAASASDPLPRGFQSLSRLADAWVLYMNQIFVLAEEPDPRGKAEVIDISDPDILSLAGSGNFCGGVRSAFVENAPGGIGPQLTGLIFALRQRCNTAIPIGGQISGGNLGFAPGWGRQVNATTTAIANFEFSGVVLNNLVTFASNLVPVVTAGDRACLFELEADQVGATVFAVGREGTAGTSTAPCDNHRTLYRIDVATQTVTGSVGLGAQPRGIALAPDASKVYVSDFANDAVYVLNNGAALTFDRIISVGDGPTGLALTADGRLLVAAWNAGLLQVVDLTTDQVIGSANSRGAHPVAVIVQGQNAFLLNYGDPGIEDGSVSAYGLP